MAAEKKKNSKMESDDWTDEESYLDQMEFMYLHNGPFSDYGSDAQMLPAED